MEQQITHQMIIRTSVELFPELERLIAKHLGEEMTRTLGINAESIEVIPHHTPRNYHEGYDFWIMIKIEPSHTSNDEALKIVPFCEQWQKELSNMQLPSSSGTTNIRTYRFLLEPFVGDFAEG